MGAITVSANGRKLAGFARSLVVATALAGVVMTATPADAQNRRERERAAAAPRADYSEGFVTAYNAVQAITQAGGDMSGARPLIPALVAAAANADEKDAAGNLMLQVGQNLRDAPLQRQGIELMLASGKVAPESQGQYYYYVGNFAMQMRDFAAARTALQQAITAGYTPAQAATDPALDPRTQVLQSLFLESNFAGLIQSAGQFVDAAPAGTQVPELWLTYGLQGAIETHDNAAAARFSVPLVHYYPTPRNVRNAVRVMLSENSIRTGPVMADAMRLLYEANAMTEEADVAAYVGSIDARVMANETLRVLERSNSTNVIPQSDPFYTQNFSTANDKAADERSSGPGLLRAAQSASTGLEAYEAGELFMSIGDYAQAETMYELALTKGSQDRDRDLMRQAIAEYRGGKKAEAIETFGQVGGQRAQLAALWQAFIASQG